MSVEKSRKRSEELAVENVRRITELLREERNNALALAQLRREELEAAKAKLNEATELLTAAVAATSGDLANRVKAFLAKK